MVYRGFWLDIRKNSHHTSSQTLEQRARAEGGYGISIPEDTKNSTLCGPEPPDVNLSYFEQDFGSDDL